MDEDDELDLEREPGKRDRTARLMRVARLLEGNPNGMRPKDIADRLGMSVRNVYRDLKALERRGRAADLGGRRPLGVDAEGFLPPLKLTLQEAMAVFLGARLMVRYADKYDPDLASAFEKLAATSRRRCATTSREPRRAPGGAARRRLQRPRPAAHAGVGRAPGGRDHVRGRRLRGPRRRTLPRTVRPFLIEPSLQTHALYLIGWDEDREAMRTFKIERIREVRVTPGASSRPRARRSSVTSAGAGTSSPTSPRPRSSCGSRRRSPTGCSRRPGTPPVDRADRGRPSLWRSTVSGVIEIRLWILSWGDDVEVLEPPELRPQVADILATRCGPLSCGAIGLGRGGPVRCVLAPLSGERGPSGTCVLPTSGATRPSIGAWRLPRPARHGDPRASRITRALAALDRRGRPRDSLTVPAPSRTPEPVYAGTAEYMEGLLLKWINDARASRGVPALRWATS